MYRSKSSICKTNKQTSLALNIAIDHNNLVEPSSDSDHAPLNAEGWGWGRDGLQQLREEREFFQHWCYTIFCDQSDVTCDLQQSNNQFPFKHLGFLELLFLWLSLCNFTRGVGRISCRLCAELCFHTRSAQQKIVGVRHVLTWRDTRFQRGATR